MQENVLYAKQKFKIFWKYRAEGQDPLLLQLQHKTKNLPEIVAQNPASHRESVGGGDKRQAGC